MKVIHYTHTDYFDAAICRSEDLEHLQTDQKRMIFSLYCAGVSIECMLRAYITKNTSEFDAKHDLIKLYDKSKIALILNEAEKEEITAALKSANKIWNNNLRYTSEKRMKRIIAHQGVKAKITDINKYLNKNYSDIFEAQKIIIQIGKEKWS
jgi:hypothetical protein